MALIPYLTTEDNPFDPRDQFDEWYAFDMARGYNTCAYIDRMTFTSDSLGPKHNDEARREAISRIMELNVLGIYKVVLHDE